MKLGLGLLTAFFSVALVMPFLEAQDEPKKSDEKKTDEKKVGEKKKIVRVDESVILAIRPEKGKIQSVKDDEDSKEVYVVLMNPEKAAHFQKWSVAEQLAIAKTGGQQRLDRLRSTKTPFPSCLMISLKGANSACSLSRTRRVSGRVIRLRCSTRRAIPRS